MKLPVQKRVARYGVALVVIGSTLSAGAFSIASAAEEPLEVEAETVTSGQGINSQLPQGAFKDDASEEVKVVEVEEVASSTIEDATIATPDRTKPIYEVYKDGQFIDVPADLQWYIHDMAAEYGFDEKIVFGTIVAESSFEAQKVGDDGMSFGLGQIQNFWIQGANITHFTDDYENRDLLNPYDNILTMMEMWSYGRDAYGLDTTQELPMKQLLYWYNTGNDPTGVTQWDYSDKCFQYAQELVYIEY